MSENPDLRKRRSEVVTVRLDPKLKYLAELAGRRQRRTLSSFIEWAIEDSLSRVRPDYSGEGAESFADMASQLWDVDEPDRFVKLALSYPDLLDHDEQRLWKLIKECGLLWRGAYRGPDNEWAWKVDSDTLIWARLREHWATFQRIAKGEAQISELPRWQKTRAKVKDLGDEIPF